MNRLYKFICLFAFLVGIFSSCSRTKEERSRILKIYNWADYIDESVLDDFPK